MDPIIINIKNCDKTMDAIIINVKKCDKNIEACHQLVKRRNIRHSNNCKNLVGSQKRKLASRGQNIFNAKNKRFKK